MPIAIGTIFFSLIANNVRTAGPIGMREAPIDVFRPREDDGAFWNRSVALGTCRLAQSSFLAFPRITSERLVRSEWERHWLMRFDLGKMVVPIENHGARATCKGTFVV